MTGSRGSLVAELQEWFWLVRLLVYPLTQWHLEQPPVQAEHECHRHSSVYGGFWKYLVLQQLQRALFALGNLCIISS